MRLFNKCKILFIGDSVTAAGRDLNDQKSLGDGYVFMAAESIKKNHNRIDVEILNLGISANTVDDLMNRWENDCLFYKPDIVSIMIGINDCHRRYNGNKYNGVIYNGRIYTSIGDFESKYRNILNMTRTILKAQIVLLEPFLIPVQEDKRRYREDLDPKIQVVRRLAVEYEADLIAVDAHFAEAAASHGYEHLSKDGLHPTEDGHKLIADKWIEKIQI